MVDAAEGRATHVGMQAGRQWDVTSPGSSIEVADDDWSGQVKKLMWFFVPSSSLVKLKLLLNNNFAVMIS